MVISSEMSPYLSKIIGAPDIPGIPPGSKDDGPNYLEFLKAVRRRLPREKTLGIAAPASFWYLKGFPIEEISKVVDYIVYMTYDMHGVSSALLKILGYFTNGRAVSQHRL